jgi:hypothetical protein
MDPDPDAHPDPAIFVSDLRDVNVNQNNFFVSKFFCLLLFEGTFTSFFKDKKSQNSRNPCFTYYFCLMIAGPGFFD